MNQKAVIEVDAELIAANREASPREVVTPPRNVVTVAR